MDNMSELLKQLQQAGSAFLNNYCVVNGVPWPLDKIENMGLSEFAARSIYSLPVKFYKYYNDLEKEEEDKEGNKRKKNYSIEALESNEVYLSSPADFDDVFDSEIVVPWSEFESFRLATYAKWSKCSITDDMPMENIRSILVQRLNDIYESNGKFEPAFDMNELGELEQGRITAFILNLQIEIGNRNQLDNAIRNVIVREYSEFSRGLQQEFRVACFTTTPVSQLMWGGSYANEHKGFCIEYTVLFDKEYEDIVHNIRPVVYCKTRRSVTKALLDAYDKNWNTPALWDLYFNGALRKSIDWAYQNEWRLLLPPQQYGERGYTKKFFPITKVYLGNRMSAKRRKAIIEICKRKGIPYTGVTRSPDMFEMQECATLCENCSQLNRE